jgi:RNA polymerase sigma factor (sigma-70 family)
MFDRRLIYEAGGRLLQNVAEEFPAAQRETRERKEVGSPTRTERFDELFVAHYPCILGVLRRMLGDLGRAEDLASEVFLKLYRRPELHYSQGNVPGWLYRTAMNLGIDALRAAARRSRYEQAAARGEVRRDSQENGLQRVLRAECQQRVRGVLAELKPSHAKALLLRACGHSYKELAETLQVDRGSVGTLLLRAEAEFEKRYRKLYGREEVL